MADPLAPPSDVPRRRRAPSTAPLPPAPEPEPAWRDDDRPSRPRESPGPFWTTAAVGVGLVCLGRLILFFTVMGDLDGELVAPSLFSIFGSIALAVGLALASLLQRGLSLGVRTALMLGAGYFAVSDSGLSLLMSSFNPFF